MCVTHPVGGERGSIGHQVSDFVVLTFPGRLKQTLPQVHQRHLHQHTQTPNEMARLSLWSELHSSLERRQQSRRQRLNHISAKNYNVYGAEAGGILIEKKTSNPEEWVLGLSTVIWQNWKDWIEMVWNKVRFVISTIKALYLGLNKTVCHHNGIKCKLKGVHFLFYFIQLKFLFLISFWWYRMSEVWRSQIAYIYV